MKNLIRAAAFAPRVTVGGAESNRTQIASLLHKAAEQKCDLAVFPELCLTGSTCGDLFLQPFLTEHAYAALNNLIPLTDCGLTAVVGLPWRQDGKLYDCAAVLQGGKLRVLVPKRRLSARERRYFSVYAGEPKEILLPDGGVCIFGDTVLDLGNGFTLGIAIGRDSADAGAGAAVLACPDADCELVGRAERRRTMLAARSADRLCAVVYANAGEGESTTDYVFGGHRMICENGRVRRESTPFSDKQVCYDIDPDFLLRERAKNDAFAPRRDIVFRFGGARSKKTNILRDYSPLPFVPENKAERARRCREILDMQSAGLKQRLLHTRTKRCVIGISGGLDSTLALLVTARTYAELGMPSSDILCVTMPCFGTTARTKNNAVSLCSSLGVSLREVPIADAVRVHFRDIGHDESKHDVTYENAQARERTQVLMDIANACGGLVVGTGDLSELALGWATYNGDHMSMYGVNGSIPKTLVKYLVEWVANHKVDDASRLTLLDIVDTPISPELIPADENGNIKQKTEDLVGPYELHDFFLYHFLRFGSHPSKIYFLAQKAFAGIYDNATVKKWLYTFFRRFFQQQFKRSCLPDGPKVGSVSLSPRGDWRMPSDAVSRLWLEEIERINI